MVLLNIALTNPSKIGDDNSVISLMPLINNLSYPNNLAASQNRSGFAVVTYLAAFNIVYNDLVITAYLPRYTDEIILSATAYNEWMSDSPGITPENLSNIGFGI